MSEAQNPLLANLSSQGMGATPPPDPNLATPDVQQGPQQMADMVQRPPGTGIAEQPQKPSDRKEFFRNMLSNFLYSFAAGAANSGTGPGANVRGAGAAILAPYQREQQQKEMALEQQKAGIAQQQANSLEGLRQAQAQGIPASILEKMQALQATNQNRLDVQGLKNEGGLDTQGLRNAGATSLEATKAATAKTIAGWNNENKIKVAQIAASAARDRASVTQSKVPAALGKYFSDYQDSVSRANIMSENLAAGLKGDQQAMLSLLANHMGMTMGLAKGARINQAMINEAQASAPWLGVLKAKFDNRGYLSGVTLTPEQMQSMVSLATGRLEQDQRKFKEMEAYLAPGRSDSKPSGKSADPLGIR